MHGYHHAPMECATWGYEESKDRLAEIASWWPGEKLFKAPGWVGNPELYRALCDGGWKVADNGLQAAGFGDAPVERYIYNLEEGVVAVHGHTWDCMGNGPSDWAEQFDMIGPDAQFCFVSEFTRVWEVDQEQEKGNSWSHASEFGERAKERMLQFLEKVDPQGRIVDFGGNDGYAANAAKEEGYDAEVLDGSLARVAFAREQFGLKAHLAKLENTGLEDGYCEWGFCSHTLEHVHDLDAVVRELRRVCRKGVWVVVPLESEESFAMNDAHHHRHTAEEWVERLGAKEVWRTEDELAVIM